MNGDTHTYLHQLADFAAAARGGVPADVAASARRRLLDIVGLQLAASQLDTSAAASRFVAAHGGRGSATAIGVPGGTTAPWAAFLNGVLAHSLDYDDTHLPSILHPSAPVAPAAVAAAELSGATGTAVLTAVAVGLEITVRLGMAGYDPQARNSTFFEHGQHATSICGTIGAAAAAALLLGLEAPAIADAMGIAASMAAGIIEANRTGGTVKRVHCGWAAHSGTTAALLAEQGITGPATALEGRFGFFQAFLHGTYRPEELTDGLGERWAVPGIFFKPYPANHFTHAGIDAAIELRRQGLSASDVGGAELLVASPTVRTIGEPLALKRAPATGYQAQFSGPYTVAAALFGGGGLGLGLADFTDELATDPQRRRVMARVTVAGDPECDEIYPHQFPAVLRVRTRGGDHLEARVLTNRGGPDRPLSDDELLTKFRENAGQCLDAATVAEIEAAVARLAADDPIAPVLAPLRGLPGPPPR